MTDDPTKTRAREIALRVIDYAYDEDDILSFAQAAAELALRERDEEIERLRKALKQSAQGWENAVELGLIPSQHVTSARILASNARTALGASHDG